MKIITCLIALVVCAGSVFASVIDWTRLTGKVKAINRKANTVMIQNKQDDLITVKKTDDVEIIRGKESIQLKDLSLDDRIVLINIPKAATFNTSDEPEAGGVYKPVR